MSSWSTVVWIDACSHRIIHCPGAVGDRVAKVGRKPDVVLGRSLNIAQWARFCKLWLDRRSANSSVVQRVAQTTCYLTVYLRGNLESRRSKSHTHKTS